MCISFGNPSEPCCDKVKPAPVIGNIFRHMLPTAIDDYAGLADATWQVTNTGDLIDERNTNCLYHQFLTQNRRDVSVFNVLNPIRWRIAAPSSDGGQFDAWYDVAGGPENKPELSLGDAFGEQAGRVGIRERFIPRAWHCKFIDDTLQISGLPIGGLFPCGSSDGGLTVLQRNLANLLPSVPFWDFDGSSDSFPFNYTTYAICHRINGRQASPVYSVSNGTLTNDALRVRVKPTDRYEIDVWYKIGRLAASNMPATPGKCIAFIPLETVSTGSNRRSMQVFGFGNVDFSPKFNRHKQTYAVTIAGHKGWRLKDGTNGPHLMVSDGRWVGGAFDGGARLTTIGPDAFCESIVMNFSQEIAQVCFVPGPAMRAKHPNLGQAVLYRSRDLLSLYRQATNSTAYGAVTHASLGGFKQDGTTVFHLVPWTVRGGFVFRDPSGYVSFASNVYEGVRSDGAAAEVFSSLPQTITMKRVNLKG